MLCIIVEHFIDIQMNICYSIHIQYVEIIRLVGYPRTIKQIVWVCNLFIDSL